MCALASSPVRAQDNGSGEAGTLKPYRPYESSPGNHESSDYLSQPMYNTLVHQAIRTRSREFEFGTLRSLYTRTAQYDPLGDTTIQKIANLTFVIENNSDPQKRKEAIDEYGDLVAAHLANIDVVSQALMLSRENKIYGDPAFYEWVQTGLLRNLISSGSGKTLNSAYDAITLGEESQLINILKIQVLQTDSRHSGALWYNMHLVKDSAHAEPYWMFVNVTIPLRFLEDQKKKQGKSFNLRNR
jgi:hypothetical protein